MNRRDFLAATAVAATARSAKALAERGAPAEHSSWRADFPAAQSSTYLNSAAMHPLSLPAAKAMQEYIDAQVYRKTRDFDAERQADLKQRFATLINAKPTEIAFVQNTSDGENIVVMGMDLARKGGNVVLDELHFETSLYMYKTLESKGLQLRVVKHRDWKIDLNDMDKAIDRNTRLVSMALVSNVNGYLHEARAIADLAHARGAYVFADMVQAAGAVPVDVRAMGIDFGSSATYKWLMGERGFEFLYVREDLQGTVVPTTRYGHRQLAKFDRVGITWEPLPGAAKYETGTIPNALAACASRSLQYIADIGGVPAIRAHAKPLVDRLQRELPAKGYRPVTPASNDTPIVAFEVGDVGAVQKKLQASNVSATVIGDEKRLRLAVSVFNNDEDIDRVLAAL
jgi:selenocysteine lyase/cysteine desulfurase